MSGFKPLDTTQKVTNEQLADAYNKLHDCVHDGFNSVNGRVDGVQATITGLLAGMGLRQQVQKAVDAGEPEKVKPKLAGMSRLQGGSWAVGIAVGAAGLYRYVFPALETLLGPAALALHRALMGG